MDWIREMPAYPEMTRLKYICEFIVDCEHKTAPTQETGYPLIRTTNIGIGHLILDDVNRVSEDTYQEWSRRTIPQPEDLILAREAPVGNVAIIPKNVKVCLGQRTVLIRAKKNKACPMFLVYLMLGEETQARLLGYSTGSTVHRLNMADIRNLELPTLPPLSIQTQIANFLDRKTGQIDELIRIKERQVELLQEKRTALINQAVTKGLDPNVGMKPSGVEWIGDIPVHWKISKVKYVGSSNPSKNNPKAARLKDTLVVFLPMERVHTDGTIDQELKFPYSQVKNGYTYFEENDVLVAKVTPCFENGKIVLIKNLETPVGFGSTEFIVIRPNTQKVFTPFLYYILYNAPLRRIGKHFMTSAVGLKRVPTEFVENFRIPIPPKQEQIQIANFLDRKTGQIDALISTEQRKIELLKEYRQSLISEAVTGKIDVRSEV